jgi:hypothetical protein
MALKRSLPLLAGALAAAALAAPAQAQLPSITPFSFEVRGGLAIPTEQLKDDSQASTGTVLSGSVTFHAIPLIGIYAGVTRASFGVDDEFSEEGEYTSTGFDVGARLAIPTPLIPIDPWIKAGLTFQKLEGSDFEDEDFNIETDTKMGYEVGAGLGFGFGPVSITPGVSYVRYKFDDFGEDVDIGYVKADIGVRIRI